jgi:hypothetical protein
MRECHNQRRILNLTLLYLVIVLTFGCGAGENRPTPKGSGMTVNHGEGAKVDIKDEKGIQQNEAPLASKAIYSSNEGHFSVAFPGTPEQTTETATASFGRKIVSHISLCGQATRMDFG